MIKKAVSAMSEELFQNIRFKVGDVEVINLLDAESTMDVQQMFPSVTKSEWEDFYSTYPNAFKDIITWKLRISCTIIRTPNQFILIDTGIGPSTTAFAKFIGTSGSLPEQMRKERINPEDINLVFLTHLHGDHVGWNTMEENEDPLFPNARYLATKSDWDFCEYRLKNEPDKTGYIYENIFPLIKQHRLEFVDEETILDDNVKAFSTPGHTPGHMSIKIEGENSEKVWLLGDAVTHPLQITEPNHHYLFDNDCETAIETRSKLLEQIDEEGGLVTANHLPGFGDIIYDRGKRFWKQMKM